MEVISCKNQKLLLLAAACATAIYYWRKKKPKKKVKKVHWIRPFLQKRKQRGEFYTAIPDKLSDDPQYYFETFRVTPELFQDLLSRVGPLIKKRDFARKSISPAERLHVTLAYLASGDQQKSIAKDYRLGRSTVCNIIHETTQEIYNSLKDDYLHEPTIEDWSKISDEFFRLWNFPNCVGALDGKHFPIPAPPNSSSLYYNYKGYFSVVLMATCDARYNFPTINIGSAGSESDGGIFNRSKLGKKLRDHSISFPVPQAIEGTPVVSPYVLLGDEAFPLLINLMRPYPGSDSDNQKRIYNYRLSRARRTIENTFGILVARWRILLNTMNMLPDYALKTIKACLAMHNYVRQNPISSSYYIPVGFVDYENVQTGQVIRGAWRGLISNELLPLEKQSSNNYSSSSSQYRDRLKLYFNTIGAVSWQDEMCYLRY